MSRPVFISLISRRSLAIRVLIRRRSSSILVSPGPREPMPWPPAAWPPACRDIDSPQPRRRGRRYCSWASSTCALPSLDLACWAKMSRISAVRSMTLTLTTSSSARRWLGVELGVADHGVGALGDHDVAQLARPCRSRGRCRGRAWRGAGPARRAPASPAVSARAASSRIEFSASSAVPSVQTPASTTRSRRSWRYSTSVTSSSSVDSPATRRSAARSSRSSWSPS